MGFTKEQIEAPYILYRDVHGLQQSEIGKTSRNGVRFTAQYLIARMNNGFLSYGEKQRLLSVIPFQEQGLLCGDPTTHDQDTQDNYIGVGVVSAFCGPLLAGAVLDYGKKHWRVYNNLNPGKFTWRAFLGRYLALFAHLKWAAGKKPNVFELVVWCFCVWRASFTRDQDSKVLTWMLCYVAASRNRISDYFIKLFVRRFKKQYETGGIGEVLAAYYNNPNHPDVRFLWKEWGPQLK